MNQINELEAELESQRSELAICLVHKSDAVADAVSRTKAESESEIARLKGVRNANVRACVRACVRAGCPVHLRPASASLSYPRVCTI